MQCVDDGVVGCPSGDDGDQFVAPGFVLIEGDRFLTGEMGEDGGGGDVGGVRDLPDADSVEAFGEEEFDSSVTDRLPGGGFLALAASGGGGVGHSYRVPGTPGYWTATKGELTAKVNSVQLSACLNPPRVGRGGS